MYERSKIRVGKFKKSPCIGAKVSSSLSLPPEVLIPMVTLFINLGDYLASSLAAGRDLLLTSCWGRGKNLSNLVAVA